MRNWCTVVSWLAVVGGCSPDKPEAPSPRTSPPAVAVTDASPTDARAAAPSAQPATPVDVATRLLTSLRAQRDLLEKKLAAPPVDIDWYIARLEGARTAAQTGSTTTLAELESAIDVADRYTRALDMSTRTESQLEARGIWSALCETGDAPSCWRVAIGLADAVDKSGYRELAKRSCELGFSSGCVSAGYQFDYARDDGTHERYLIKGCEMGDPAGCGHLAAALLNGIGVTKDRARALTLFTRACTMGHASSCAEAGTMHVHGMGTRKDVDRGVSLFERACALHNVYGCSLAREHADARRPQPEGR